MTKLSFLKEKLQSFAAQPAWSKQVEVFSDDVCHLTLVVANRFVRDWIQENILSKTKSEASSLPGEDVSIEIIVDESEKALSEESSHAEPTASVSSVEAESPKKDAVPVLTHETLKSKYTFDNFVVGASNQFAHAAAQSVAQFPARRYNPLFMYGGVGLGKTHLLNAIGMEFLRKNPKARIVYITSEKFMNELIYCLRFQKMPEFRKKYRDTCDLLLMDDVQFLAGKERTQDEFFHTFNYLHDGQRQIVLTSDRPPREIPDLEERLRSRFEWGLLADIQVPDLETRMAILKKKADDIGAELDNDLMIFLATNMKSNIRELEGSLIRVHAFASLQNQEMSVDFAKNTLKDVLGTIDKVLTVEQIQKVVSEYFRIKHSDLIGKRRMKSLALPRQIAMYLCRKHLDSSYPEIGDKFGGKDHSTVVHAFNKISGCFDNDPQMREQIVSLEKRLN